jgi:hypothetical protein
MATAQTFRATATSSFTLTLKNLPPGTTVYIQAYATNSTGTGYGKVIPLTTAAPPPSAYTVTTYAGNGLSTSVDAPSPQASFQNPIGVAVDPTGVLYVTEGSGQTNSGRIRRITTTGNVSTFLNGIGLVGEDIVLDTSGNIFDLDYNKTLYKISSTAVATPFVSGLTGPISLDIDKNGNLFITDAKAIKKITPSGQVTTLPLTATTGFLGIAVDQSDNIYVSDGGTVEKTDTLGNTTIIAGAAQGLSNAVVELRLDHNGNLIAADAGDFKIKLITLAGTVTTIAGTGIKGDKDGPGLQARFTNVAGMAIDAANNIYVVDGGANKIKKITHN